MRVRVALVLAVLGLALVALLVEFRRVLQRPRRSVDGPPLAETDDPGAREPISLPPPASSPSSHFSFAAPSPPRRPTRLGIAHLKGRVVIATGAGDAQSDALDGLAVTADDGRRTFEAHLGPRPDRFDLHLPPGRYTLTAQAGDLVGVESNVVLVDGALREVTVVLASAVSVTGRIHGAPDDSTAFVLAYRAGTKIRQGDGTVDGDVFSIGGLREGQAYDLEFGGDGMRATIVRGIAAPLEGLDVTLSPLPVLRGAVGFARGTLCPFTSIRLASTDDGGADRAGRVKPIAYSGDSQDNSDGEGGEGDGASSLSGDCHFELTVPEGKSEVTVIATGPGWDAEERVVIPADGDPHPVCLNPPCRNDPLEGLANLVVSLDVQTGNFVSNSGTPRPPHIFASAGGESCAESDIRCQVRGLPVGEPIQVEARGSDCTAPSQSVVLSEGENFVSIPCVTVPPPPVMRRVQGILRTVAGGVPERFVIRCAGTNGERNLRGTLVFSLDCPRETAMLEYRLQREGPWLGVAIPAVVDPALVEISVGL